MAKLDTAEFRNIQHSVEKLWARCLVGPLSPEEVAELGGDPNKEYLKVELETPAIGTYPLSRAYAADDKGRVGAWQGEVLAAIDNRRREIDEDGERAAIERAQAQKRAAEASAETGGDAEGAGSESGVPASSGPLPVAAEEATPPHAIVEAGPTTFAGRRDELVRAASVLEANIAKATTDLRVVRRELLAIDAALEIMNAQEDDEAEPTDVPTETTGP